VAWGANAAGQLGDGTTTTRKLPTLVTNVSDAAAIAAGGNQSMAIVVP